MQHLAANVIRPIAIMLATIVAATTAADACSVSQTPLAPKDRRLCQTLLEKVRVPSALPLDAYEAALNDFFQNWCHRDRDGGWQVDKGVRDTGPYTSRLERVDGKWQWVGDYHGTHTPVAIWYSPDMVAWLRRNRPAEGDGPAKPPAVPDGAVMVKEMYPAPASACVSGCAGLF